MTARADVLPRPVAVAIIAALLVCAAAAWLFTAEPAASMSGMGGMAMLGAGLFLAASATGGRFGATECPGPSPSISR